MGALVKRTLPLALLGCVILLGCAQTKSDDPVGDAYSTCIVNEAEKQGQTNRGAEPDGVDAPGGPCANQEQAFFAQMKGQHPDYTDKEVNDIITDVRNAIWRNTMKRFAL